MFMCTVRGSSGGDTEVDCKVSLLAQTLKVLALIELNPACLSGLSNAEQTVRNDCTSQQ